MSNVAELYRYEPCEVFYFDGSLEGWNELTSEFKTRKVDLDQFRAIVGPEGKLEIERKHNVYGYEDPEMLTGWHVDHTEWRAFAQPTDSIIVSGISQLSVIHQKDRAAKWRTVS